MLVGTVEATFLVLLVVIVFGPILAERVRVPGIVGLIFGGMLFGPFVIGWVEPAGLVAELGAIGILMLMFIAGVSFDTRAFLEHRRMAITYGLLGFFIPFVLSITVVLVTFEAGVLGAALIGAMWASNTLVAYPEVQTAGLQGNRAVSAAVSAGVVADLLSLTVLAVATATTVIESEPFEGRFGGTLANLAGDRTIEPSNPDPTLPIWLALPLLAAFCLWLLPRLTEWFFVRVGRSRMQRFVFALAGMSAGATMALLGGVEGLIGAFLAGLGMNRLVPAKGPLMERLEFVGASIFVPAFLVSIGLNIDPSVLVDRDTLVVGAVFTGFVVVGKSVAAIVTGRLFGLSFGEVGLMASLSFGQAASTLAIAQVGLSLGMFDQIVVNAAVIAIVATALITSYGTRAFARRVPRPDSEGGPIGSQVLLDVRPHGSDLRSLATFSGTIARADDGLVVPYGIAEAGDLGSVQAVVDHAVDTIAGQGLDVEGIVRVDESFAEGTVNLVSENDTSMVVLSWRGPRFTSDYLFGNDIDGIGEHCPVPTVAARVLRPWNRVVVATGRTDAEWRREDADLALELVRRLAVGGDVGVLAVVPEAARAEVALADVQSEVLVAEAGSRESLDLLRPDDLVLVPAHALLDLTPRAGWRVTRALDDLNVAVVAGPHRLSVSHGVTRQPLVATVSTGSHTRR